MHKSSACGPGRADQCICGPSGTGKSHFCEALDQLAIDTARTIANDGLNIDVPLTQDELASIIAASRESVVRAL